jgi:hypothetical protein
MRASGSATGSKLPYQPGRRAMQKFKVWQTLDFTASAVLRGTVPSAAPRA